MLVLGHFQEGVARINKRIKSTDSFAVAIESNEIGFSDIDLTAAAAAAAAATIAVPHLLYPIVVNIIDILLKRLHLAFVFLVQPALLLEVADKELVPHFLHIPGHLLSQPARPLFKAAGGLLLTDSCGKDDFVLYRLDYPPSVVALVGFLLDLLPSLVKHGVVLAEHGLGNGGRSALGQSQCLLLLFRVVVGIDGV